MKRFTRRLRDFFLPPAGTSTWVRVLPYAVLGLLTLIVLSAGAYTWEYTNSPDFCGTACHTMPPEYTAYLTSPHARVDCVDCHIGKGFIATRITRKAGDLKHVFATVFKTYEFPIQARELRPARETCERCHSPEKFSDDSLRTIQQYGDDPANTPSSIYLVLKTGGGSKRLGLGRGIHWHIVNQVFFLPADSEEQEIPYVRVVEDDGSISEYIDINSDIKPSDIDPEMLEEMDCITCHNRITHLVPVPEDMIDQMISQGLIAKDIPDIRRQSLEVYSRPYDSVEAGLNAITGIENYYKVYRQEYYAENQEKIAAAIAALQTAFRDSVFPEQNSDWTTHPNNVGHKDSPGCLRCHDGEHLNANNEAIRLECNLCHSIPVTAGPEDFVTDLEISRGPEPQSHLNPNWISLHRDAFDPNCANCHTTDNPGGTENTSFCSNSGCHGNVWEYAGFDAPALREILLAQLPPTPTPAPVDSPLTYAGRIGPIFAARCGACHGQGGLQALDLTTYQGTMTGSANGIVITPGDPEGSLLIQTQSGDQPHFGQLTVEELEQVSAWIKAGAPEK
jgi:nitrate/TMAO reductase-like tetraheme cytochrome c subunit/mono/diheme cytochrome c family protein